jgi:uncharacterized lipoprotein YajG
MFKTQQTVTPAVATLILTGCANTYNPLEDFEQVEPAAVLDSPSATTSAIIARINPAAIPER